MTCASLRDFATGCARFGPGFAFLPTVDSSKGLAPKAVVSALAMGEVVQRADGFFYARVGYC
jgi:hypothetical protein